MSMIQHGRTILFVEPEFPIAAKSKNHSSFLPIGLLKLAAYYRNQGFAVELHRGNYLSESTPEKIMITSLFTYWAEYVRDSVQFYKSSYPKVDVIVGGIYASLMPEHCKSYTNCDHVFIGQHEQAESCYPAYDLVDVDYQIIHGMRGCTRTCSFCGIWRLEKKTFKDACQIQNEIKSNKIVLYDNNLLANPDIENILLMIKKHNHNKKVIKCDAQSGIDGRILEQKPYLARMLKNARFKDIRIAWDFGYNHHKKVENWIDILKSAGYNHRSIFVFMIYNWEYDFEEMELKRQKCFQLNTQIADCRFRPLDSTYDNYNGSVVNQTNKDYFIHNNWSDSEVKEFRRNVRKHNICIRYKIPWSNYDRKFENQLSRKRIIRLGA